MGDEQERGVQIAGVEQIGQPLAGIEPEVEAVDPREAARAVAAAFEASSGQAGR